MIRIKQFIKYVLSFFRKTDKEFLKLYLNNREMYYFNKLLKTEREHSIRVAKRSLKVLDMFEIEKNEIHNVVKMCLLHDIGKSYSSINLFFKPIIVLISKNRKFRKIIFFPNKDRIFKYFNHAKYSSDILKTLNYSSDIVDSIKYHHSNRNIINNKYIKILKYCDSIG